MQTTTSTRVITNGVSTDVPVRRMLDRFHTLKEKDIISYDELVTLAGASYRSNRFNTIVTRARRQFFLESGIQLKAVTAKGLEYPTGREQLDVGKVGLHHGLRKVHRHGTHIARITDDRLNELGRGERDFYSQRAAQITATAKTSLTLPKILNVLNPPST